MASPGLSRHVSPQGSLPNRSGTMDGVGSGSAFALRPASDSCVMHLSAGNPANGAPRLSISPVPTSSPAISSSRSSLSYTGCCLNFCDWVATEVCCPPFDKHFERRLVRQGHLVTVFGVATLIANLYTVVLMLFVRHKYPHVYPVHSPPTAASAASHPVLSSGYSMEDITSHSQIAGRGPFNFERPSGSGETAFVEVGAAGKAPLTPASRYFFKDGALQSAGSGGRRHSVASDRSAARTTSVGVAVSSSPMPLYQVPSSSPPRGVSRPRRSEDPHPVSSAGTPFEASSLSVVSKSSPSSVPFFEIRSGASVSLPVSHHPARSRVRPQDGSTVLSQSASLASSSSFLSISSSSSPHHIIVPHLTEDLYSFSKGLLWVLAFVGLNLLILLQLVLLLCMVPLTDIRVPRRRNDWVVSIISVSNRIIVYNCLCSPVFAVLSAINFSSYYTAGTAQLRVAIRVLAYTAVVLAVFIHLPLALHVYNFTRFFEGAAAYYQLHESLASAPPGSPFGRETYPPSSRPYRKSRGSESFPKSGAGAGGLLARLLGAGHPTDSGSSPDRPQGEEREPLLPT